MTTRRTIKSSRPVEWLTPDPLGNEATIRWPDRRRGPWELTVHWARVDGRPVMVGVDIRSFVSHDDHRHPIGPAGLVELTHRVLRGIPIAQVREQSRATLAHDAGVMAEAWRGSSHEEISTAYAQQAATLTAKGRPRKRLPSAGDDLLAKVAALYTTAVTSGSKTPARYIEEQLRESGVPISVRSGRALVRKWIQRARERGLLPPAGHPVSRHAPRKGDSR